MKKSPLFNGIPLLVGGGLLLLVCSWAGEAVSGCPAITYGTDADGSGSTVEHIAGDPGTYDKCNGFKVPAGCSVNINLLGLDCPRTATYNNCYTVESAVHTIFVPTRSLPEAEAFANWAFGDQGAAAGVTMTLCGGACTSWGPCNPISCGSSTGSQNCLAGDVGRTQSCVATVVACSTYDCVESYTVAPIIFDTINDDSTKYCLTSGVTITSVIDSDPNCGDPGTPSTSCTPTFETASPGACSLTLSCNTACGGVFPDCLGLPPFACDCAGHRDFGCGCGVLPCGGPGPSGPYGPSGPSS